ncbi:NUDIX hydrolase [Deinococcus sp. QL22]|uniref:NUDIX hydrolase n=1 Tax=Deinococcus sp. QL22 TaxID=2939437 RepID=UPI002017D9A4|nr:NUDIX domain-containing protein [Deinococcus sp. QL22]UQN06398.1 NUDIX domain-containing protein [Deinococcus sp. QL22]
MTTDAVQDYIPYLRRMVGTSPVNLMGAVGIILNDGGDVLLQRLAGRDVWGLPGGLCELGEPPQQTMTREVREETGLDVLESQLLELLVTPHRQLPNGDEAYFYTAVYHVTHWQGTPVPDSVEGIELAFFGVEGLPALRGQPAHWTANWLLARSGTR